MSLKSKIFVLIVCAFSWQSCSENAPDDLEEADIVAIDYDPTTLILNTPQGFPEFVQPSTNSLTFEGVSLGRKLFYDKLLSVDETISCASCHLQESNFTDDLAVSVGVDDATGNRSAMSLLNVAYYTKGLFWDGRSESLEDQAIHPVEDVREMANTWTSVEERLRSDFDYPFEFRKAFGIKKRADINRDLVTKAIAQFERTMVSSGTSKFDRFIRGEIGLDEDELDGYLMFFDLVPELPDAECGHCHSQPLFTTNEYFNNGIDQAESFDNFLDNGRGEVVMDPAFNGTFRVPSLRNITKTAPYMHDGRFNTLEEVLEHYNSGGKLSPNKHPLITKLKLSEKQKGQIISFLKTLDDDAFNVNPSFSNPF